jgi:hypothetical protein
VVFLGSKSFLLRVDPAGMDVPFLNVNDYQIVFFMGDPLRSAKDEYLALMNDS